MGHLTVSINGHDYKIACDDGQEERISHLASVVEERVQDLLSSVGQVGDARMLVMVSLLLADEVTDLTDEIKKLRAKGSNGKDKVDKAGLDEIAGGIETLADRIESIATRLEQS